jgi:hypoxanthine-DNA glycosylase
MDEIIRNRTIRPSSRLETSKSYKINTKAVTARDILIVNIDHESKSFRATYKFHGKDVAHKDSISFRVNDYSSRIDITWSGAMPIGHDKNPQAEKVKKEIPVKVVSRPTAIHLKTSFEPISNKDTQILILGTMPGDKSIEMGEYYGHPRNRFWKIISAITNNSIPDSYEDKQRLLHETSIGIWDVAHKAQRKGSLDSNIEQEEPNDINSFMASHKKLRVIGFNGTKSEALFDKYFERQKSIKYVSLPSSSPANTGISFEAICKKWQQLLID